MPTTIKLRNSVTTTNAPSSLLQGEVAINITDKKVWVGNAATTPIQLLGDGGSASFTAISLSANLNFTSTGNRITGDMSNATVNNRLSFQTSVTNGATAPWFFTNGTGTVAGIGFSNASSFTNSSFLAISISSGNGAINVDRDGTGAYLPLTISTGGTERLRIDTSGNVGIGTNSPNANLHIGDQGASVRIGITASNQYGQLSRDISTGNIILNAAQSGTNLTFQTVSAERMRIDSSGNVGIGTSSFVWSNAGRGLLEINGSTDSLIALKSNNTTQMYMFASTSIAQINATANIPMAFYTNGTERMRIREDGAVLIATTTSLATLTVNGNISPVQAPSSNWGIDFTPSTSSGTYVTIANDATYDLAFGSGYVYIYEDAGNGVAEIALYYGVTNIRFQSAALYNVAANNAGTINVYYNSGNARYRIQNKTGSSKVVWISTLRFRNAV